MASRSDRGRHHRDAVETTADIRRLCRLVDVATSGGDRCREAAHVPRWVQLDLVVEANHTVDPVRAPQR